MANAFTLFGSLKADTGAFERAMKSSDRLVSEVGRDIDQTAGKAVKLGLTSATTARQFEKLNERLLTNRNLLHDAAKAFQDGDISAKRMASTFAQVERATVSVSSRVRDLKAQLSDLQGSTSQLEIFRQGIAGQQGGSAQGSFFSRLSGFQKQQLSFQANDIISGLAMGQSPFQILTQQSGQIFQILTQTKATQEGITKAANASAIAQKAFAAESSAAAQAIAQSHQGMTILGASAVSLGAVFAAGTVAIAATYKITQDIEKATKKRLELEQKVTDEWNKQFGLIGQIKKDLADAAKERAFDRFLGDGNAFTLAATRNKLQAELDANQKLITGEMQRRQLLASKFPQEMVTKLVGSTVADLKSAGFNLLSPERIGEMTDQIKKLDAQIDELNAKAPPSISRQIQQTNYQSAINAYQASVAAQARSVIEAAEKEKKAAEERRKLIDENISKVKDLAQTYRNALSGTFQSYGAQNPFVKLFNDANTAMTALRQNTLGLSADLRSSLTAMQQATNMRALMTQRISNALEVNKYQDLARQFRAGSLDANNTANFQANIDRQLKAIGVLGMTSETFKVLSDGSLQKVTNQFAELQREVRSKAVTDLLSTVDPARLTPSQRSIGASAFDNTASALRTQETNAATLMRQQYEAQVRVEERITELVNLVKSGKVNSLDIAIQDSTNSTSAQTATPQLTKLRYR